MSTEMKPSKLQGNICRICLKHNANLNWNDEISDFFGVRYKDCYFKYTQLCDTDKDFYPRNLCENCANGVKNAHILFEKALESFLLLQNTLKAKDEENDYMVNFNSSKENFQTGIFHEDNSLENLKDDTTYMDIEEVTTFQPIQEATVKSEGNRINKSEESLENIISNNERNEKERISAICSNKLLQTSLDPEPGNEIKTCRTFLDQDLELKSTSESETRHLIKKSLLKNRGNKNRKGTKSLKTVELVQTCPETYRIVKKSAPINKRPKESFRKKIIREKSPTYSNRLLEQNLVENEKTTLAALPDNSHKSKQLQKISDSDKEITDDESNHAFLEADLSESDTISSLQSKTKSTASEELQKPSEAVKVFDQKDNSDGPSKKPLRKKKAKRHICQYCPYRTHDKRKLLEHEARHLENRERNVTCSICGVKFYTQANLYGHMDTHAENRIKKHKCEFCEKAFFHKGALNVHKRIHLGLMFKCQICEKECFRQIDLDRHLMGQHSYSTSRNVEEKKKYVVQCQYCNKSISTSKLRGHVAMHLNKTQAKCKICEKEFFSRSNVRNHLRRFHKISSSDCGQFVHDFSSRVSFLKIRQQAEVKVVI